MKKFIILIFCLITIVSFGYTSINFNFLITFGSTNTTYSQIVKLYYIDDSIISTITFNFKKYPQKIIIDNEEFIVYSKLQKFITGSGKINIKYNNKNYEFLLNNEELIIGFEEVEPNIKLYYYTKNISPNNDWYNDSLRLVLYSNTYCTLKILGFEKYIYPGKNELYIPINLKDGNYNTSLKFINSKGIYTKDIEFKINRNKKTYTKYIILSILGLFIGFIGYNIIK
ncbi:hypothetical protein [Marinitoga sp. 38H-ov]|uniref:hypothetical protein n=1 Tax=Marinitoga sp. 38H-ov TaxID=1755814 RepID=UPI0013EB9CFB|nr:hypothetical protein [Marinitoga sp. 38H-ov]KAF2956686.1 hypothetical protein AS160_04710 [Marinitoga sp. 38H-ov]